MHSHDAHGWPCTCHVLVFHLFGALAEFERAIIRERTRAGLAAARALLTDPAITMAKVARRLQVSPATLYRHMPGGRSSLDAGGPDQRLSPL